MNSSFTPTGTLQLHVVLVTLLSFSWTNQGMTPPPSGWGGGLRLEMKGTGLLPPGFMVWCGGTLGGCELSRNRWASSSSLGRRRTGIIPGISLSCSQMCAWLPSFFLMKFSWVSNTLIRALVPCILQELKAGGEKQSEPSFLGRPQFANLQNGERHCYPVSFRQGRHPWSRLQGPRELPETPASFINSVSEELPIPRKEGN